MEKCDAQTVRRTDGWTDDIPKTDRQQTGKQAAPSGQVAWPQKTRNSGIQYFSNSGIA